MMDAGQGLIAPENGKIMIGAGDVLIRTVAAEARYGRTCMNGSKVIQLSSSDVK